LGLVVFPLVTRAVTVSEACPVGVAQVQMMDELFYSDVEVMLVGLNSD
jgi:hypothetical protein